MERETGPEGTGRKRDRPGDPLGKGRAGEKSTGLVRYSSRTTWTPSTRKRIAGTSIWPILAS